jgi:hypothetical protein
VTRTTILLDDDLLLEIKQLARTSGTTATDVIRERLRTISKRIDRRGSCSFLGLGKSGRSSIAKNAEKFLKRKANRREG